MDFSKVSVKEILAPQPLSMRSPRYSIIIPVYNRPHEVDELLQSLTKQEEKDFEVIIVEDGSTLRCDDVVDLFRDKLHIQYYFKPNSGPGPSRNFGFAQARGDYFVVFDSDCIIPGGYLNAVSMRLNQSKLDAWGGPDRAQEGFTLLQRAMGYTMSSFLTTGGIRGGKKHVGWFQPRSFNMGISRTVFEKTGGFHFDRYAEDIEFSIRMKREGFKTGLIPEAFVYHKRRTSLPEFFRQVVNFGKGRAMVGKIYPEEVKVTHWFPTLFLLAFVAAIVLSVFNINFFWIGCTSYFLYMLLIFFHSWMVNKSFAVALLSVPSAIVQLSGYGIGFFKERMHSSHRN